MKSKCLELLEMAILQIYNFAMKLLHPVTFMTVKQQESKWTCFPSECPHAITIY